MEIAQKFPNYAPIQSQLITIYIRKDEYEKAIDIAQKFPNDAPIQSQLMTVYIKIREYEKVLEIAQKFPNDVQIQSQLITIYIRKDEYEKAMEIAQKFPNDALIQSQLITIYMKKGEYEKILEIAQQFPNDAPIQSQLITIYTRKCEYEKALEIAQKFPNYAQIQSQLITIYTKKGEYEKAIDIAQNFSNDVQIQSQLITIYTRKGKYEKAIEIAQKFPNDTLIQSQLITIYIRKGEYEKAMEIAKKFPSDAPIQSRLITIYTRKSEYKKAMEIVRDFSEDNSVQNQLKTPNKGIIQTKNQKFPKEIFEIRSKIIIGIISVQDLDTLEKFKDQIGLEKYLLIKIAIYEKLGLINICKNLLKQDKILNDKIKKQLIIQFEKKNKFYNLEKWDTLIGWFSELNKVEKKPSQEYLKNKEIVVKDLSMKKSSIHVTKEQTDKEIIKTPNNKDIVAVPSNKDIAKESRKVIRITSSKTGISKKKKQNIKNKDNTKTLNDMLNQTYKEMILNLKIKYYKEMHDLEKRQAAIYKYDRLEDILSSEPNIRNFDLLLLMLIGDGDNRLKLEQSIPKQYNDEYKKVLSRINSRRKH